MAIDNIIIGTTPNDKTGDTLRVGATKINSNFNELDTRINEITGSDLGGSFVNLGGDTMTGDLTISGSLNVSGSTVLGGNIIPKTPNSSLGTVDNPFSELFLQSSSLYIEASNQLDPTVIISNQDGNLALSTGGMILTEPGNSFMAETGSFSYLSGSMTQVGDYARFGITTLSGSLFVSGSTVQKGNNTLVGNTVLSGPIDVLGNIDLIGIVNISGSTIMSGSLEVTDGISTVDYITFDTTPENTPTTQGTFVWNDADITVDLIQNGTTLQLGQEQQYNVKNETGQTIPNGMPVMAVGTHGASGDILAGPMDGSSPNSVKLFLGLATEEILNNGIGKVTHFGKVRGIDTSIYNTGDILWISSSANGELTNIEPLEPNIAVPVAFVLNSTNNGTIIVRVNNLNQHEFTRTNENSTIYADLTVSGSFIVQNPAVPTSISGSGTQNEIRTDSDYIYVCIAPNSWKRTPLSTW